jgi:hypothetical protein
MGPPEASDIPEAVTTRALRRRVVTDRNVLQP